MRIHSSTARYLLKVALLWMAAPFVGIGLAEALMRWGIWALPAVTFVGVIAAAAVIEVAFRLKQKPTSEVA